MPEDTMPEDTLLVLRGDEIAELLAGREAEIVERVAQAYTAHALGHSSLPHSNFLRFPDSSRDRIIALPAYLGQPVEVAGIKWIASVPANVERGLERASAAMILNHRATGRPFAFLEASIISARRTAASAALAARALHRGTPPDTIGLVGCGVINFEIARFLRNVWPGIERFRLVDLSRQRAEQLGDRLNRALGTQVEIAADLDEVLASCEVVSFATTVVEPFVPSLAACPTGATVLHVSLRDLLPEVILAADNVVDDVDHVARAGTSIDLAAQSAGHRDFIRAEIGDVLLGRAPEAPADQITVFSPFGLGILDLAVADLVFRLARAAGVGTEVRGFLPTPWTER